MKKISLIFLLAFAAPLFAQDIGEMAPPKPPADYPDNSWGVDLMFSEGGFGIGTFFRKQFTDDIRGFVDFSLSESKDEKEVEFYDYFGNKTTPGKKNRVFMMPLNFGVQYRLFKNQLTDNLRPYLTAGAGPSIVVTTPYEKEFFSSFGKAKTRLAAGGYIGLGANFGISKSNLVGLNVRYYYVRFFDNGVENLANKFRKTIGGIYLSINVGIMY